MIFSIEERLRRKRNVIIVQIYHDESYFKLHYIENMYVHACTTTIVS